MKVSVVLSSVDSNPAYYKFLPLQVRFWGRWGVRFVMVMAAPAVPPELEELAAAGHVILWNRDLDLSGPYLGQNLRTWYAARLHLPEDEMVLITDMDMLPLSRAYFMEGLEHIGPRDFVHYRTIAHHVKDFTMCYNAAHPSVWADITGVRSDDDVSRCLRENLPPVYDGQHGGEGWWSDQKVLYRIAVNYPHLRELRRPLRRLDWPDMDRHLAHGDDRYTHLYDDAHFHRNFDAHARRIADVVRQVE
jgi:hypothetical protein